MCGSSLSGLRLGFCTAADRAVREIPDWLLRILDPWVSSLSVLAAGWQSRMVARPIFF